MCISDCLYGLFPTSSMNKLLDAGHRFRGIGFLFLVFSTFFLFKGKRDVP